MNPENKISLDYLLNEIKDAFKDGPCPKDEEILLEGMAEAEYCGNKTAGLSGVRWLDLPANCYSKKYDYYFWPWLIDLTPVAYHYYLPGYIIIAAQYYDKCNVHEVVRSLILNDAVFPDPSAEERFELFSLPQKHAIKLFLEYLIAEHSEEINDGFFCQDNFDFSPHVALAQYWGKY